jgi:hypothetical protein
MSVHQDHPISPGKFRAHSTTPSRALRENHLQDSAIGFGTGIVGRISLRSDGA